jgi:hypothetical protein
MLQAIWLGEITIRQPQEGSGAPTSRKNTGSLVFAAFLRISVEQFHRYEKRNQHVKNLCDNSAPSSFPGATRTGTFFQQLQG